MFIGPIFTREAAVAPRRGKFYVLRTAYGAALAGLTLAAYVLVTGTQVVSDVGDLARFGALLFQILVPLQLAVTLFAAAMTTAGAVAQEKDRRTLVLLLLTNLSNSELVLGKLLASLLQTLVMLAAALPLLMLCGMLGGVSFGQIGLAMAVTAAAALAGGSLGSLLALWREKTFQALATTALALVLWLAVWEVVGGGAFGRTISGVSCETWAIAMSPRWAVVETTRPLLASSGSFGSPVWLFLAAAAIGFVLINGAAIVMVRVWNPSREARPVVGEEAALETAARAASERKRDVVARPVWDNPILWREVRTWAYGRKILVVRLAYLILFSLAAAAVGWMFATDRAAEYMGGALVLVPLFLLSLVLVNAQSVTSMTGERDAKALDLLLVTDLTPKEIVFGKLAGAFYNTKEMVALPTALCVYLWWIGGLSFENLVYLLGGLTVMYGFVVVLGLHAGMHYHNSQAAIATSLGTVFFLFLGVAVCMRMMVAFSGSFQTQQQVFLALMLGGGVGLYAALGARNPSTAIGVASFLCPIATFYAITSYWLGSTLGVFLVTAAAYGFTTAAMLVPAVFEFDVATGRTTADEGG